MTFENDIENKVKDYLNGDYEVTDAQNIPSVNDVALGKKAKKLKLCAFCIDMRDSSDLLFIHQKQTCGKIHKAFLTVASQAVLHYGGEIRSFNGDGILAFWPASTKEEINKSVSCAMHIKYLLDIKLSPLFEQYEKIDFGIGIDLSEVYVLRAGISRDTNNNDLVFIGPCVNIATAIANQAKGPHHIEISENIYVNLPDTRKFKMDNGTKVDKWRDGSVEWKGKNISTKGTTWYLKG